MSRKHKLRNQEEQKRTAAQEQRRTSPIVFVAIGVVVLLVAFAAGKILFASGEIAATSGSSSQQVAGGVAQVGADGVQEVRVTMKDGYLYQPDPIRLTVGVPARLVVDLNTVTGCMRSIQIPELGVQKRVAQGDNVIAFTPTKAGTFVMRCAMNMGQGRVIVEDASGNVPAATATAATQAPLASGGGCGMAAGDGCSCGGA